MPPAPQQFSLAGTIPLKRLAVGVVSGTIHLDGEHGLGMGEVDLGEAASVFVLDWVIRRPSLKLGLTQKSRHPALRFRARARGDDSVQVRHRTDAVRPPLRTRCSLGLKEQRGEPSPLQRKVYQLERCGAAPPGERVNEAMRPAADSQSVKVHGGARGRAGLRAKDSDIGELP